MARRASVPFLLTLLVVSSLPWRSTMSTAQDDATPAATASASPVAINEIVLPTEEQVPNGLVMIEDRDRTLDEITANFSDPAAARERFVAWGWQRNSIRAFHVPEGTALDPTEIDGIYISVHAFGSPEAAADALTYSFDVQAATTGLSEMPIDPLGDSSRALYGKVSYGNEITLYVQQGTLLIRLSASSPEGDPRAEATELMRAMLEISPPAASVTGPYSRASGLIPGMRGAA
jgi:hypothetical protein